MNYLRTCNVTFTSFIKWRIVVIVVLRNTGYRKNVKEWLKLFNGSTYKLTKNDKRWQKWTISCTYDYFAFVFFQYPLGCVKWNELTKLIGLATCRSWQKMTKWTNWQTIAMSKRDWDESGVLFSDIIWVKKDISSLWMIAYRYCTGFLAG